MNSEYRLSPTEVPDIAAGNKNAALPASQVHSAINPAFLLLNIATIDIQLRLPVTVSSPSHKNLGNSEIRKPDLK